MGTKPAWVPKGYTGPKTWNMSEDELAAHNSAIEQKRVASLSGQEKLDYLKYKFDETQGGSGILSDFAAEYQAAIDEANAANEQRYSQILGGYDDRFDIASSKIQDEYMGDGSYDSRPGLISSIKKGYEQLRAKQTSNLKRKGLHDYSILQSMSAGIDRRMESDVQSATDQKSLREAPLISQHKGEKLAFMERRNDVGPDYNMLYDMATSYGYGSGLAG